MSCDLDVDTDLIRHAAQRMREAAGSFRHRRMTELTFPSDHAAGNSAIGRQALRLVTTRTEQAVESTQLLALMAERLAEQLEAAAERFDAAEARCVVGG